MGQWTLSPTVWARVFRSEAWAAGVLVMAVGLGMIAMTSTSPVHFARPGSSFGCGAGTTGVGSAVGSGGTLGSGGAFGGGAALACPAGGSMRAGDMPRRWMISDCAGV